MHGGHATRIAGRHYQSGRAIELEVADGRFAAVREIALGAGETHPLPWIAPGFVDLQVNGYGGQEFSSPELTCELVAEITRTQATFGVTQFCPTVTTAGHETLAHAMATIAAACRQFDDVNDAVAGIHLEGPYIAREDGPRGAHPHEHCREPDWSEFENLQRAAGGRIRIVTLSPEYSVAADFICRAHASGVVVAIGHTAADSAQIRAAVEAGATLSTHLGNGAHRKLRRHPNYIWDQLAEDRLAASLIVDGHHLPGEVVQSFVRGKTPERCILISDLSGMAGLPPGQYATELCDLEILADGRLVIAGQDQLLAGAAEPIGTGIVNVMRFAGVDLATAVHMATHHPRRLLGMSANDLGVGEPADAVLFDLAPSDECKVERLEVRATLRAGELIPREK